MQRYVCTVLYHGDNFVHIGQVQAGIYALAVEVHCHSDNVHIACALAVAQQRTLNPIGTGHYRQFASSDTAAGSECCGRTTQLGLQIHWGWRTLPLLAN